jgi:hypothetical protein
MKSFKVSVEKRYYETGTITVQADDEDDAVAKVQEMMVPFFKGGKVLQSNDPRIEWTSGLVFEDDSFDYTGEVEEV